MTSPPVLHHEKVHAPGGEPTRWILVLHGIYGAGRNWRSVFKRLVGTRPDWGAFLIDLRGHGGSTGFAPPHTIEAAAADLERLAHRSGIEASAVLGHSFGGKVALRYFEAGSSHLRQAWVVDSTPSVREPTGSAWRMLGTLRRHPGPFESRKAAVSALEGDGLAGPVAQWMATNLIEKSGGFGWRIDPEVMEALLRDFFRTDTWHVLEAPPDGSDIHVLKAAESSVLSEAECLRIEDAGRRHGRVHLHRVAGGHWVNADNPSALLELLSKHLPG